MRTVWIATLMLAVGCAPSNPRDIGNGNGNGDNNNGDNNNNGGNNNNGNGNGNTPMPDMTAPPQYPSGPYGNQQGQTLANLSFSGYRLSPSQTDSTQLQWDSTIAFGDYHANPACKCLVITIGALWCSACQDEQPSLAMDVSSDPSFCVLGILMEGENQGVPATKSDVDTWTQYFMQNFVVAQGTTASENLLNGYGPTIGLPFSFIVKPQTMTVLDVEQGFDQQIYANATALCGQ